MRSMRPRGVIVVAVVVALVAGTTSAWASHSFVDVPDTHPFHAEISQVADAGITTGFPDGGFRPEAGITRQAEAAFMTRGLGRAGFRSDTASLDGSTQRRIAGINFMSPSPVASGTSYLLVTAAVNLDTSPIHCSCAVEVSIWKDGSLFLAPWTHTWQGDSTSLTRTTVIAVPTGSSSLIEVGLKRVSGSGPIAAIADMTIVHVPFYEDFAAG